jgi:hypothetical protein
VALNDLGARFCRILANTWDDTSDGPDAGPPDPDGKRPLVVEGRRAVAEGTTSYANGDFYWNLWTLRFDEEDRCVEWFVARPRD